jgi:hypothetical protein
MSLPLAIRYSSRDRVTIELTPNEQGFNGYTPCDLEALLEGATVHLDAEFSVGTSTIQDAKVTAGATVVVNAQAKTVQISLADAIAEIHEYVKVTAQKF